MKTRPRVRSSNVEYASPIRPPLEQKTDRFEHQRNLPRFLRVCRAISATALTLAGIGVSTYEQLPHMDPAAIAREYPNLPPAVQSDIPDVNMVISHLAITDVHDRKGHVSLVTIKGGESTSQGTGEFVQHDNKAYELTAAHVIGGDCANDVIMGPPEKQYGNQLSNPQWTVASQNVTQIASEKWTTGYNNSLDAAAITVGASLTPWTKPSIPAGIPMAVEKPATHGEPLFTISYQPIVTPTSDKSGTDRLPSKYSPAIYDMVTVGHRGRYIVALAGMGESYSMGLPTNTSIPGASGSPVVNAHGQEVGILDASSNHVSALDVLTEFGVVVPSQPNGYQEIYIQEIDDQTIANLVAQSSNPATSCAPTVGQTYLASHS